MRKELPTRLKLERRIAKDPVTGCWNWTGVRNNYSYGMFSFNLPDGRRTTTTAHRASYQEFVGPLAPGAYVCHRCDNPLCINPAHLFVGTQLDNMKDMQGKGRSNYGHGGRPFAHSIDFMREVASDKRAARIVAKDYGVSQSTVCRWRMALQLKLHPLHLAA